MGKTVCGQVQAKCHVCHKSHGIKTQDTWHVVSGQVDAKCKTGQSERLRPRVARVSERRRGRAEAATLERGTYFRVLILAEELAHSMGHGFNEAVFVHDIC